jgi:glyoxylase-like metal-dependent hydrolase (beta-lactamase superfamily II)
MRIIKINFSVLLIITVLCTSLVTGQKKPADGDLKIGDFKVRMLQDAQMYMKISHLSGIEKSDALKLTGGVDSVWASVNAYLVRTPQHTVLVDAGIGKYPGENSGHLLEYLKRAGVEPEQIDLVLITHFHFDHIGGLLTPEGRRAFPNAVVRASQVESDFWMGDESKIPANMRERAKSIKVIFAPYIAANLYKPFKPDEILGEGIKAMPAYGHTPGHTVFAFSSKGEEIWCIGDLIHIGIVQFSNPAASMAFDSDKKMALTSRVDFLKRAAASHIVIAGAHLGDMLRLEVNGSSFIVSPVDVHK